MSTVKITVSFSKDAPEFPFFKISECVKDFDTVWSNGETTAVEYRVYEEDAGYVEAVINEHPGAIAYTVNDIVS